MILAETNVPGVIALMGICAEVGKSSRDSGGGTPCRAQVDFAFFAIPERVQRLRRCLLRKLAIFTLLAAFAIPLAFAADGYKITKKIPIPGRGGWDYLTVDASARR